MFANHKIVNGDFIESRKSVFTYVFKSLQRNIKMNDNPFAQISKFCKICANR